MILNYLGFALVSQEQSPLMGDQKGAIATGLNLARPFRIEE